MKKIMPYVVALILFGGVLALEVYYELAYPSVPSTYYDGIYVDLMAQTNYDAWREAKDPSQPIYVLKVDKETNLPICMKLEKGDKTIVTTSFLHNGVEYDLQFENNVLVGVRKSYAEVKAALAAKFGISLDSLSDEQEMALEQEAAKAFFNNSWQRDTSILSPILNDYAAQVQALSNAVHLTV